WEFVDKAAGQDPKMFLCEGTNLLRGDLQTEDNVYQKTCHVVSKAKGLVLASFSQVDVDRLRTFHDTASKYNRKLGVSLKQAFLLNALSKDPHLDLPDPFMDSNILVYRKQKKSYYSWEKSVMGKASVMTAQDVRGMQGKVILV